MIIPFSKYHGAGNDFILIDNTSQLFRKYTTSYDLIAKLCHRRFGIGADGLILINKAKDADFSMIYYNSNGKPGSMCGNGGRCIAAFAKSLKLIRKKAVFDASDGIHHAEIISGNKHSATVKLQMQDVVQIKSENKHFIIDTGSPHYIEFRKNIATLDVVTEGRKIRYSGKFRKNGINVNFAEVFNDFIFVRTYERGVEDETLSCGTGSTAVAIAANELNLLKKNNCNIKTNGGNLKVFFSKTKTNTYADVWLEGPVKHVFDGTYEI